MNKTGAKVSAELTDADQKKWDSFQNEVRNGTHPKEAATKHRCDDYKALSGNQYQIRLSGKQRATFLIDEKTQTMGSGTPKAVSQSS